MRGSFTKRGGIKKVSCLRANVITIAARPGVNTPGRAVLTCAPYGVGTSNANVIPAPIEIANRLMKACHDSCV